MQPIPPNYKDPNLDRIIDELMSRVDEVCFELMMWIKIGWIGFGEEKWYVNFIIAGWRS